MPRIHPTSSELKQRIGEVRLFRTKDGPALALIVGFGGADDVGGGSPWFDILKSSGGVCGIWIYDLDTQSSRVC